MLRCPDVNHLSRAAGQRRHCAAYEAAARKGLAMAELLLQSEGGGRGGESGGGQGAGGHTGVGRRGRRKGVQCAA